MLELNMFGSNAVFDHIGLGVTSIKEAVCDELKIVNDEIQKVSVAFISMNGIRIELIEPLGENTPITLSLKRGQQLVHLCFRVDDLQAAIRHGRAKGFDCLAKPTPARAFGGKQIAWLFSRTYGFIELLEK